MHYAVTYLAANYAGAMATRTFMPTFHDPYGDHLDDQSIAQWFTSLPWLKPHQAELTERAKTLAATVVRREQKAITALAIVVAFTDGLVSGKQAEQVLRETLVRDSLLD
jgi:hypothetical protein